MKPTLRLRFPAHQQWSLAMLLTALVITACSGGHATKPAPVSTQEAVVARTGPGCTLLPPEAAPLGGADEFTTDFSTHCVHYSEILSGGPPRDGIPALNAPKFVSVRSADAWLKPVEPVIFFQVGDDARAYPIQILIWHEIVNDTVGGVPVAVTFCPLCNTAIAFERTVDGQVLDFGTTGRLRYSNLLMYDRQTESWWQQATGLAMIGAFTGTQLASRPAAILSWAAFKAAHPEGKVLSRDTGYDRPYGQNPYPGYDNVNQPPFLYTGPPTPGVLPPMARVLAAALNGEATAYPFDALQKIHVVDDTIGGSDVVVFWMAGTASPLDGSSVAGGHDVGTATMYLRALDGKRLTFQWNGTEFVDQETGSAWNELGQATSGTLAGKALTPVVAVNSFWFAWVVFQPDTRVYHA